MSDPLRELLDKQEIHEVLLRYCRAADRRDPRLFAEAFHPDAFNATGGSTASVAERVRALCAPPDDLAPYSHLLGNHLIEVDGDVAWSEASFVSHRVTAVDGRRTVRIRAGRYLDRFERRDGRWRIAHRVTTDDWSRLEPAGEPVTGLGDQVARASSEDPSYEFLGGDAWRRD